MNQLTSLNKSLLLILVILVSLCLPACGEKSAAHGAKNIAVNVVVTEVKPSPLTDALYLVGTLAANEAVDIKSEIDGKVEEVLFTEGQAVKKDDLLIVIDRKKLEAELAQARANYTLAKSNLDRNKSLLQNRTISSQEYDAALAQFQATGAAFELAQQRLNDALISAPFSGVMAERLVSPGQVVTESAQLTSIVSIDPLKIEFSVPERYSGKLVVGKKIETQVEAFPEEKFAGEVYFVSPDVDPATRTVLVKAKTPNLERKLKPGMFANVKLIFEEKADALLIPESALMLEGQEAFVFVVGPEDRAERRKIVLGRWLKDQVEIVSGVTASEKVVIEGTQKIQPGAKLSYS